VRIGHPELAGDSTNSTCIHPTLISVSDVSKGGVGRFAP